MSLGRQGISGRCSPGRPEGKIVNKIVDVFAKVSVQDAVASESNLRGHISLGVATSLMNFTHLELLLGYFNIVETTDIRDIVGVKFESLWLAIYRRHHKALRLITYASDFTAEIPPDCVFPDEGSYVLDLLLSDRRDLDRAILPIQLSNYGKPHPLTILIYAAEIRALEFLLARGASLETIMSLASKRSWLAHTTEIFTVMPPSELSWSVICERLKTEAAIHVNGTRPSNLSPFPTEVLQACVRHGHAELVKLGLMRGTDSYGAISPDEALATASRYGHPRVVKVLLEHWSYGPDFHGVCASRKVPPTSGLHEAIVEYNGQNEEVVKLLLEAGADPAVTNSIGQSSLDLAYSHQVGTSSSWPSDSMQSLEAIIKMLEDADVSRKPRGPNDAAATCIRSLDVV
ncbi:hypothetical protein QBC40DRAFT_40374 [Triangularia verruculosa]|uniref:Ankyrin n=1 Tax=Triangularia verruculosa TaxID=2587418 RepID=A0AAN7APC4_9PEZI|nr:hypothetical protein QBC40DRAFT_40374 [Triangularia verruculosa]